MEIDYFFFQYLFSVLFSTGKLSSTLCYSSAGLVSLMKVKSPRFAISVLRASCATHTTVLWYCSIEILLHNCWCSDWHLYTRLVTLGNLAIDSFIIKYTLGPTNQYGVGGEYEGI